VLLQAHKSAVQELTSQLSESTSVTMRQKAELSTKEVHLQRLDGKLSEQQTKMTQLQSSVSKDRSEVQRLTAQLEEKQSLVEGKQDVVESLGTRLTASIEEVSAVHNWPVLHMHMALMLRYAICMPAFWFLCCSCSCCGAFAQHPVAIMQTLCLSLSFGICKHQ